MRTPIIVANFKMHRTAAETVAYASALVAEVGDLEGVEIVFGAVREADFPP